MRFNVPGIAADGAMTRTTADVFITAMNGYNRKGYPRPDTLAVAADQIRSELQHEGGWLQLQWESMGGLYITTCSRSSVRSRASPW